MQGTIEACHSAQVHDVEAVRAHPDRLVRFTPQAAETSRLLTQFLHARAYHTPILVEERDQSAAAIELLFEFLLAHPDQLPPGQPGASLPRRISDYIASMTDPYFRRVYASLAPQFTSR